MLLWLFVRNDDHWSHKNGNKFHSYHNQNPTAKPVAPERGDVSGADRGVKNGNKFHSCRNQNPTAKPVAPERGDVSGTDRGVKNGNRIISYCKFAKTLI